MMGNLFLCAVALASLITGFTGSRVVTALQSASQAAPATITAAVLLPSVQCHGITVTKRRCRRSTTDPSGLCSTHRWQAGTVASNWR